MSHTPTDKEHLSLWLPQDIDAKDIPGNGERSARIAFFGNELTTRLYNESRGYININSKNLRHKISNKAYEAALEHFSGDIEIDKSYSTRSFSKGYRWSKELSDQPAVLHTILCPNLVARLSKLDNQSRTAYGPLEAYLDLVLMEVALPVHVEPLISTLPPKPRVVSEEHRRNVIRASSYAIQNGNRSLISTSKKTGRVFCQVNHLSSHIRPHLHLYDEPVIEIDLANSQPYFLATLFKSEPLIEAVSDGVFYQRISDSLDEPINFDDKEAYGVFKQAVLAHIYACPKYGHDYTLDANYQHREIAVALGDVFPGLNEFIVDYRTKYGGSALPIAMQRLESDVFISCVLAQLYDQGTPAIPIHDSILCRVSDAYLVMDLLYDSLLKATSIPPSLKPSKKSAHGVYSSPFLPIHIHNA